MVAARTFDREQTALARLSITCEDAGRPHVLPIRPAPTHLAPEKSLFHIHKFYPILTEQIIMRLITCPRRPAAADVGE